MAHFEVVADFSEIEKLIARLPNAEEAITSYMQSIVFPMAKEILIGKTPISDRNKKHAAYSDPYKMVAHNLGFEIVTKGGAASNKNSYGYLIFPDEGRGPSNPIKQNFTDAAKEKTIEEMIPMLKEHLLNYMEGK